MDTKWDTMLFLLLHTQNRASWGSQGNGIKFWKHLCQVCVRPPSHSSHFFQPLFPCLFSGQGWLHMTWPNVSSHKLLTRRVSWSTTKPPFTLSLPPDSFLHHSPYHSSNVYRSNKRSCTTKHYPRRYRIQCCFPVQKNDLVLINTQYLIADF